MPKALSTFIEETGTLRDTILVVERAAVPSTPTSPNLRLNLTLALMLGLILGGGIALLKESVSDRIKDVEELERVTRHPGDRDDPNLKFAPSTRIARSNGRQRRGGGASDPSQRGSGRNRRRRRARSTMERPWLRSEHRFAKRSSTLARRRLSRFGRFGLLSSCERRQTRRPIILVTSAEPRAGKSTTAANYASLSAFGGSRVLIVDADVRTPVQHEIFGISRSPGLVEYVADRASLEKLVQRVSVQLHVLTAGQPVARASDVTHSSRIGDLLVDASKNYDVVVMDTSPVLATADAEAIAAHDGVQVVFVLDHSTRRRNTAKSLRRLDLIDARDCRPRPQPQRGASSLRA